MGAWYLVRHGETEWNRANRIQGHTDVPLSDKGRNQVSALAPELTGVPISAVYSSDLSRTVETAQILLSSTGLSVQQDRDLREFSYGEWEGLTLSEVQTRDGDAFAQRFNVRDVDFAAPGGESAVQLVGRVRRFYDRVVAAHDGGENVLVAAHGGSVRALALCLLGLPVEHFWRFRVDCAGLTIIENHAGGRVLRVWNHVVSPDAGIPGFAQ